MAATRHITSVSDCRSCGKHVRVVTVTGQPTFLPPSKCPYCGKDISSWQITDNRIVAEVAN